jgi:hypothetical protein
MEKKNRGENSVDELIKHKTKKDRLKALQKKNPAGADDRLVQYCNY